MAAGLGTRHRFHGVQPVLPVADAARAARYFTEVLGFELDFIAGEPPSYARVKHVPPSAAAAATATATADAEVDTAHRAAVGARRVDPESGERGRGDAVYIRLWQVNAREARPWRGEIVIHVGHDLDGLHQVYRQRGVEIVEAPLSQPWGLREFAIREPDGHVLRFCGYLAG